MIFCHPLPKMKSKWILQTRKNVKDSQSFFRAQSQHKRLFKEKMVENHQRPSLDLGEKKGGLPVSCLFSRRFFKGSPGDSVVTVPQGDDGTGRKKTLCDDPPFFGCIFRGEFIKLLYTRSSTTNWTCLKMICPKFLPKIVTNYIIVVHIQNWLPKISENGNWNHEKQSWTLKLTKSWSYYLQHHQVTQLRSLPCPPSSPVESNEYVRLPHPSLPRRYVMHRCAAVAIAWGIPWIFIYRKKKLFFCGLVVVLVLVVLVVLV